MYARPVSSHRNLRIRICKMSFFPDYIFLWHLTFIAFSLFHLSFIQQESGMKTGVPRTLGEADLVLRHFWIRYQPCHKLPTGPSQFALFPHASDFCEQKQGNHNSSFFLSFICFVCLDGSSLRQALHLSSTMWTLEPLVIAIFWTIMMES